MKWFQVDSDTPNDPRIRAIARELGAEGIGGLFLVWCFIADHGQRPGRSIDSAGRPFPVKDLQEASKLDETKFDRMVAICIESGHFKREPWEAKQEIVVPAMRRRADTYTKRKSRTK